MKNLVLALAVLLASGCVMIDSRVSDVHPSIRGSEGFSGRFENLATYRSESITGLHQPEYLQDYFDCFSYPERAEDVQIKIVGDVLTADVRFGDGRVERRKLILGRDCIFKDGYLVFPQESGASGGRDSPTLGFIGTGGTRWTIDDSGSLVIVSFGGGAGTIGIIPVGAVVRWMAVFRRLPEPPNQALQPTPTAGTSAAEQPLVPAAVVADL